MQSNSKKGKPKKSFVLELFVALPMCDKKRREKTGREKRRVFFDITCHELFVRFLDLFME